MIEHKKSKRNMEGGEMVDINELAYHIEWLEPEELIPYENNSKLHDRKNIENIANSIRRYGWQQNLTITKDRVIIIGHGRQLAAIELGVKVPCKVIDDELTDDDIHELRIADNLTQDGLYDWDKMNDEIGEFGLNFDGFDFEFGEPETEEEAEYETTDAGASTADQGEYYRLIVDCEDAEDMDNKFHALLDIGIQCRIAT